MPLTLRELAGFGASDNPVDDARRRSRGAIKRYVSCLERAGLDDAFYLQDPRQELVTEAHRQGDPCYASVSDAIYEHVKVNVGFHLGLEEPTDAEVQAMLAAYRAKQGFTLSDAELSADDLASLMEESITNAELDAQDRAEQEIVRVHAQDTPEEPVQITTPEEQQRLTKAFEAASAARGPIYSCPPGTSGPQCARIYQARQPRTNWGLILGLVAAGLVTVAGIAAVRSRQ